MSVMMIHGVPEEFVRRCQVFAGIEEDVTELHLELHNAEAELLVQLIDGSVNQGMGRYRSKTNATETR
jgi:hypothetical protein